jgi:hypothetical protein
MISLLLQNPIQTTVTLTSLLGVYIALGATVTAAGISAWAAINASRRAASTAERVTTLTTQTTEKVAALSAQVTRESSTLAARTAQELKDKDYKNDYYKKIIDKRLEAIQSLEEVIGVFRAYGIVDDMRFNIFIAENKDGVKYTAMFQKVINNYTWYSLETLKAVREVHQDIVNIFERTKKISEQQELLLFVESKSEVIGSGRDRLINCIGRDMHTLYDIDTFLASRFSISR